MGPASEHFVKPAGPPADLICWLVNISGRVQGVYFRAWTQQQARALGIRGWVRNEADGSVSALLQHEDPARLEQLYELLAEGPPAAEVLARRREIVECPELFSGFEVRRS